MAASSRPLIQEAIACLRPGTSEPYTLDFKDADRLRGLLAGLPPGPEFVLAVAELCSLAGWLEQERGSAGAKNALLDVAAGAIPALRALNASTAQVFAESLGSKRSAYSVVTGNEVRSFSNASPAKDSVRGGTLAQLNLDKLVPKRNP